MNEGKCISLLVPMYNEEECVDLFFRTVIEHLEVMERSWGVGWEILVVDDGSSDGTAAKLTAWAAAEPRIKGVVLSRNFGKEAALSAALELAGGDAVIPMDADLQDPPELIPQMVEKWLHGAQMVICTRTDRSADTWGKRTTSSLFYRVFNKICDTELPENTGDYRLMDKSVVNVLRQLPERNRFMKGLFAWVGFTTEEITFARPERCRGKTKWNYLKLCQLALDGITSFSIFPLRVWLYVGFVLSFLAFAAGLFFIAKTLFMGDPVQGFPSLMVTQLFLGGLQLLCLGFLGEYIGKIYRETKRRPLYVISHTVGGQEHAAGPQRTG